MFNTAEIHSTVTQLRRGMVADLATLLNLLATGHVDGPWRRDGHLVIGQSGVRVMFTGAEVAVMCPKLYSDRTAPRGGVRQVQVILRTEVEPTELDDLAVYVHGIDTAIQAANDRMTAEPEPVTDAATALDNATAIAVELAGDAAKRNGRYLASL